MTTTRNEDVFQYANDNDYILVTCNRDDFLSLIGNTPISGLIILVRRPRRALERAALVQLIERVGGAGLRGAIHLREIGSRRTQWPAFRWCLSLAESPCAALDSGR